MLEDSFFPDFQCSHRHYLQPFPTSSNVLCCFLTSSAHLQPSLTLIATQSLICLQHPSLRNCHVRIWPLLYILLTYTKDSLKLIPPVWYHFGPPPDNVGCPYTCYTFSTLSTGIKQWHTRTHAAFTADCIPRPKVADISTTEGQPKLGNTRTVGC